MSKALTSYFPSSTVAIGELPLTPLLSDILSYISVEAAQVSNRVSTEGPVLSLLTGPSLSARRSHSI